MQDITRMSEDDWTATYHPKPAPTQGSGFDYGDGCTLIETYREVDMETVRAADQNCVWTVLDVDGSTVIASGVHHVNRMGYIVTKVPCGDKPIEVVLDDD